MHSRDANTAFANALVDEWARGGVQRAVVAPGSRSTPLALALARDARIDVHVVLDERSAGFLALGIAKRTGTAAIVVCTSGTAAANLHPAVVEAHHANVPLLVCTADRPPELRDVGAPQTIEQAGLFGATTRWRHDPGPPDPVGDADAGARWRTLACRALAHAAGARPGPVHLNLPFREPLVPTGAPLVDAPGRADGRPWVDTIVAPTATSNEAVDRLDALVERTRRGLVVVGFGAHVDPGALARFATATGWPVLADAVSNARVAPDVIASYEALLRVPSFASAHLPDVVVRIGAPLTSKAANAWLADVPTVLVDEYDEWLDPARAAQERVVAPAAPLLDALATRHRGTARTASDWYATWVDAERRARAAIDRVLDEDDDPCEARIARDVAASVPDGTDLVVASSLPVRALEWCMAPRDGVTVHANRGANGIDGFVSTVLGIARSTAPASPTVALLGDLCFLHDTNGLLAAGDANAVFVVVDNRGGGIFGYLPQHDLPEFEDLFATPQGVDLAAVATAHGVYAERVGRASDVPAALKDAIAQGGVRVIVVPVDRDRSAERHRDLWDAVAKDVGV
jgi:2-succinyl-5-enolpyruvyl-6-hydroxy-3-cyclohexene-1-carboxylate synthase